MEKNYINKIKDKLKPIYRGLIAFTNFSYHFLRFWKYSGIRKRTHEEMEYNVMAISHTLEKSMGMKNQKIKSGWNDAILLQKILSSKVFANSFSTPHKIGTAILEKFVDHKRNNGGRQQISEIQKSDSEFYDNSGTFNYNYKFNSFEDFLSAENFFMTRYSHRSFLDSKIDRSTLERIITLASKTPSVCNRQEWFTYIIQDDCLIQEALSHQAGNRGFGNEIKNLMIICTDLSAFIPGQEAYQQWIDGGMFSMSIVYAIHSIGLVSCCLNWSVDPKTDLNLRDKLKIKNNHSVMMMLAFGEPELNALVCHSRRKPIESFYKIL